MNSCGGVGWEWLYLSRLIDTPLKELDHLIRSTLALSQARKICFPTSTDGLSASEFPWCCKASCTNTPFSLSGALALQGILEDDPYHKQ